MQILAASLVLIVLGILFWLAIGDWDDDER